MIEVEGAPRRAAPVRPVYRDAFIGGETLVRFHRGADGRVRQLSLGVPRLRDLRFTRIAD